MPSFRTALFGEISYEEDSVILFPEGLPGFSAERRFLALEQPANRPLVFVQSLSSPDLCFMTLPVLTIDSDFQLHLNPDDRRVLGLGANEEARIGRELACLAVLSVNEGEPPTANLLAPVVVSLRTHRAVQSVQHAAEEMLRYRLEHALEDVPC